MRTLFRGRRRRNGAFRESNRHRETFVLGKRRRGDAAQAAVAKRLATRIVGLRPGRASVACPLNDSRTGRQVDCRDRVIDRKFPEISGHVPIEFVVVGKESDLAIGRIGDFVHVRPFVDNDIGAADLDTLAGVDCFDIVVLFMSVARDTQHIEAAVHGVPEPAFVGGREIAKDAMPDVDAFRHDRNPFGHREHAGSRNGEVARIIGDAFVRRCG